MKIRFRRSPLFFFLLLQFLFGLLVFLFLPKLFCSPAGGEALPLIDSLQAPTPTLSGTPTPVTISLWRTVEKKPVRLDLEDYVAGVVAGEMPGSFEPEALKAQAVAARTYALAHVSADGNPAVHAACPLCDSTHCQVYRSPEELRKLKSDHWMTSDWVKIQKAVKETEGQVLFFEGSLVLQPLFHSSSGGRTENSEDVFTAAVPYLRSVESQYETDSPHNDDSVSFSFSDFASSCGRAFGAEAVSPSSVRILSRSTGGRVVSMQIGTKTVTGRRIRDLFNLNSANFTVSATADTVTFHTSGFGHGVGMSQWGANGMAKNHCNYITILTHYYSGTTIQIY